MKQSKKTIMDSNIEIFYRNLPYEIVEDFKKNIDTSITINITQDKEEKENFTGGPADIIIYVDKHLTELIANGIAGLVGTAIYESIKTTWKKLLTYYIKKQTGIEEDKNYISLHFNLKADKTLEYNLDGNIDAKSIDKLTEKIFAYLKDNERQNKDFQNSDYKNKQDLKPKIRMRYNSKTNTWEPVNFAENEKWINEQMRQAQEKYNG